MGQEFLTASFQAGAVICCTLLLRALLKKRLPRLTFSLLWTAALLRLLLPVPIASPLSVYNLLPRTSALAVESTVIFYESDLAVGSASAAAGPAAAANRAVDWPPLLWAAAAALLGILLLAAWLRSRRQLRDALPLTGNAEADAWLNGVRLLRRVRLCTSDRITSPLTCGILRPRILLPSSMRKSGGEALTYILNHELVHIRRFDCLWKGLFAAACCLHWFNPLVWVMLALAERDMELSCDEAVLRRAGRDARESYALSMIALAQEQLRPTLLAHFSKSAVHERVATVMRFRRFPAWATAGAALLAVTVATLLATSPWEEAASDRAVSYETGDVIEDAAPLSFNGAADMPTITVVTEGTADFSHAAPPYTTVSYQRGDGAVEKFVVSQDRYTSDGRDVTTSQFSMGFCDGDTVTSFRTNALELLQAGLTADQIDELDRLCAHESNQLCKDAGAHCARFTLKDVPAADAACTFNIGLGRTIGPFLLKTQKGEALAAAKAAFAEQAALGKMSASEAEDGYIDFFFKLMCVGLTPTVQPMEPPSEPGGILTAVE